MRKRRLFPRLLSECVEPLVAPAMREHGFAETRIIRCWENIVGPELGRHAAPHRLIHPSGQQGGGAVLVVHASGGFATEIQHMEPVILERLAVYFGYRAVAHLRIEQVAPAPTPVQAKLPSAK